jgi:hypothetical protein
MELRLLTLGDLHMPRRSHKKNDAMYHCMGGLSSHHDATYTTMPNWGTHHDPTYHEVRGMGKMHDMNINIPEFKRGAPTLGGPHGGVPSVTESTEGYYRHGYGKGKRRR